MKLTIGVIGDNVEVECTCGTTRILKFKDGNQYYCEGCSTEYDLAKTLKENKEASLEIKK